MQGAQSDVVRGSWWSFQCRYYCGAHSHRVNIDIGILSYFFQRCGGRALVISSDEFGDGIASVIWNEL